MRRLALTLVGLAAGVVEVALAYRTGRPPGIIGGGWRLLATLAAWWAAFAVAVLALRAAPRRVALAAVLLLSVAVRLAALNPKAPLSNDLYRYAWDGRVQAAGIDPYRYPADAAALQPLRHGHWLWSLAPGCVPPRSPACTQINRPSARTIYPPGAQLYFLALHAAGASRLRDTGYELAGLAADLAVLGLLWALLRARGRDARWVGVYGLCPAPVVEYVQNAHVDVIATLTILLAVEMARRQRPVAGAVASAVGFLVKLYPGAMLVLALRRRPGRALAAFLAVVAVAYLPHMLAVGPKVLGFLPTYLQQEHYDNGARYQLLDLVGVHGRAASTVVAAAVAAAGLAGLRASVAPETAARRILGVLLLATSPVQTWYGVAVVALVVLDGAWWWLAVVAASYPLYFATILDGPASPVALRVGQASFAAAAAAVLLGAAGAAWAGWADGGSVRLAALAGRSGGRNRRPGGRR